MMGYIDIYALRTYIEVHTDIDTHTHATYIDIYLNIKK